MAGKINSTNNKPLQPMTPAKKKTVKMAPIIFIILFFLVMGIGAGAIYGISRSPELVNKYKAYEYPLIGKFFPRPKTNFESVETMSDPIREPAPLIMPNANTVSMSNATTEPSKTSVLPQNVDLQKQQKAQQAEAAKRISKLARLYGNMKPDEAAPILSKLDDTTILEIFGKMEEEQVSRLLPLFETQRAANLTQMMMKGTTNR
ncbi:MAG: hypothetical protein H6Q65_222 [Firmicutes bacterium]|nr:hypothetical protein [Bacillota bacterium]